MKVKCTEITSAGEAIKVLAPLVPGLDLKELFMLNIVLFRISRAHYGFGDRDRVAKAEGINFKIDKEDIVDTDNAFTRVVDSIRFGIRTDKEGMLDMGKLAKKFNDRKDDILAFVEHEKKNDEERDRRREERFRKYDVSKSLVDEGLLDAMEDSIEETDSCYRVTLVLETDEELREVAEFYSELKKRREVTA